MDDNKLGMPEDLTDDELGSVTGGAKFHIKDGRYFVYVGSNSDEDWNRSYLCPKCGRPVQYTSLGFFKCKCCDEEWWFESKLAINEKSKVWEEVSREEYLSRYEKTRGL